MEKNELMMKFHNYKEILKLMDGIDHYESLNSHKAHEINSIERELEESHQKLEKIHQILSSDKEMSQTEEEIRNLIKIIKSRESDLEIAYRDFDDNKTILQDLKFDYQVALGTGANQLMESNQDLRNSLKEEVRKLIKEKNRKANQIKSIDVMNYYIDKYFLMELRVARESGLNVQSNNSNK